MGVTDNGINVAQSVEKEKYWSQVLAVVIASLASISDGMLIAWSSPFIVRISNDKINYNINETEASYFAIIPPFAMIISSMFFAELCDKIGRKRTLLLITIPQLLAWILKAVTTDLYVFYAARCLAGMGQGCIFATLPAYVGEITSPKVRGVIGCLVTSLNIFGQFVINLLGNYFSVQNTSYICMPLPVIFFGLFSLMPESPYYFIMKKKDEEAKKSLMKLRLKKDIIDDFLALKFDVDRQMSERGTWKDLFFIESNMKAVKAGTFLRISQMMGGAAVFSSSTQFIFEKSGGSVSSKDASIIFTFTTFSCYLLAGVFVDKIGRRKAYTFSMLLTGIILFLETLYFYLDQNQPQINLNPVSWFPLVGMIFFVVCASFGLGIVPTLMIGELFSASVKSKANTLMVFVFSLMIFVSNNIFYQLHAILGLYGPFLVFSCSNFISAIISYCYLPETKGKTLEEIQQSFKNKQT